MMEWGCSACGKLVLRSEKHLVLGNSLTDDKFTNPKMLVRMHMECSDKAMIQ